ncbi:MAG: hypothetical protein JRI74_08860, partial [Deltaproteobacteria bacterium]|nr:hypothetical protein [Deltaproteobacteria bacterium]
DLTGKQVLLVANLEPATLMGVESHGMILAAVLRFQPVGQSLLLGETIQLRTVVRLWRSPLYFFNHQH